MRLASAALVIGLSVAIVSRPGPAQAQLDSREAISLQNQILELRHEMQGQAGSQAGGQAGNASAVAPPVAVGGQTAPSADAAASLTPQLLDRVSALEGQVRDLRGALDQLTNQVQQQNAALAKQIGDLGFAQQQAHPPTQVAAAPPPAAEMLLQSGQEALARRDYAAAEAAAHQVLANPKAAHQADARFLLAQSQAGQRQYQLAATTYYDVYSHAPHGPRAPDALLGVSAALLALGDKTDACQALHKLHVEFAQLAPRTRQSAASLRGRAGCH